MIATAKFPLQASVVPNPKPTSDSRFSGAVLSFSFGFARRSRSGGGGGELWVVNGRGEMGFLQQLRRGCFKGLCLKKERKVEVEAANGGEDLFDAAVAESRVQPDHLVIMVNGIIGRYKLLYGFVELDILLA